MCPAQGLDSGQAQRGPVVEMSIQSFSAQPPLRLCKYRYKCMHRTLKQVVSEVGNAESCFFDCLSVYVQ